MYLKEINILKILPFMLLMFLILSCSDMGKWSTIDEQLVNSDEEEEETDSSADQTHNPTAPPTIIPEPTATPDPDAFYMIESLFYPGSYIKNESFDIELNTDTAQLIDFQFRILPGLADPAGLSFESVSNPGYYIHHDEVFLSLALYVDQQQFKEDTTFYPVAGLADAAWISYQSYNYPDRYIKATGSVLRIDEVSGTIDEQKATFRQTES